MESAPSFNINTTLGALQIGVLVSYMLFGITTTQAYVYYGRFPEDSLRLKCLVAFVWSCELGHAFCIGWGLYRSTITDYDQPGDLQRMTLLFDAANIFGSLIALAVRSFFSFRVYALSEKAHIPIFLGALSFLYFLRMTTVYVGGMMAATVSILEQRWQWAFFASWSVGVTADIGIAATLVYIPTRNRNIGLKRTAVLVDKLIAWTIETGILTSLFSIFLLVCYLTMRNNFIWTGLLTVESRLFANSFLASLNSRTTLRALNDASLPISMPMIHSPNIETTRITLSQTEPDPDASGGASK